MEKKNLTSREVFLKFVDLMEKQTKAQVELAKALTKVSELLGKRMWGVIYLLVVSLLALAGVKIGPTIMERLIP